MGTFNGLTVASQLLGTALAVDGVRTVARGRATLGWLPVRGRIVHSMPGFSGTSSAGTRRVSVFTPGVLFEYEVGGQRQRSNLVGFRGYFPSVGEMWRVSRRYTVGEDLTVWYNPADPSQAVLERGAGGPPYVQVLLGCALALLGTLFELGVLAA
jgi:hypothetical protein